MAELKIKVPRKRLEEFCKKHHIRKLAFFGMHEEPAEIFRRDVDLLTFKGVETSRNPVRRKAILASARVYYVA